MSDRPQKRTLPTGSSWRQWEMQELPATPAAARPRPASFNASAGAARYDAEQQASKPTISAAEREALLAQFRRDEKQRGFKEGRQAGFTAGHEEGKQAGYEEGLAAARAEADTLLQSRLESAIAPLQALMDELAEARELMNEEVASHLVELALAVGRQLAREALTTTPEEVLNIVRELLHSEPSLSGKPRLWLHPEDAALVREHLGIETDAAGWVLQPDDEITRGGCRLTSPSGEIDATWEERWKAITTQVRKPRRRARTPSAKTKSAAPSKAAPRTKKAAATTADSNSGPAADNAATDNPEKTKA